MPHITANGVRTFYRTLGEGPPLLLIAGNGMDHTAFDEQLPVFAEHFRCIVYDLRGIGSSEVPESGYTPAEMAKDALALMSALEIDRAHVAGYSLGGAIAQEMALAQPERVLSLSLYSSYERPLPYMRLRYDILIKVVEETTPELWAMYSAFSAFGPEFINAHERALRDEIAKRVDRWSRATRPRARDWPATTGPSLRMTRPPAWAISAADLDRSGSTDAVTPAWHSQRMHQLIAGSTLTVFPDKPHRILNFEAAGFTRSALEFLLKNRSP